MIRLGLAFVLGALLALVFLQERPAYGAGALVVRGQVFAVEVAASSAARGHGLMDRSAMPPRHGMLFVFPDSAVRSFWMKRTRIPLDMVFLDRAFRVVNVVRSAPPCVSDPCPVFSSVRAARYVIELNAGQVAALGVRPGDRVRVLGVWGVAPR